MAHTGAMTGCGTQYSVPQHSFSRSLREPQAKVGKADPQGVRRQAHCGSLTTTEYGFQLLRISPRGSSGFGSIHSRVGVPKDVYTSPACIPSDAAPKLQDTEMKSETLSSV